MSRKKFTPDQIRDVLKQISSLNLTLVGGQAVNLLAYHYRKPGLEWDKELPFTSEDLDLLGGKLEAVAIQSHCGGKIRHADVEHAGPNSAVILIPMKEGSLRIDVLKYICAPSPEDINRNAIEMLCRVSFAMGIPLLDLLFLPPKKWSPKLLRAGKWPRATRQLIHTRKKSLKNVLQDKIAKNKTASLRSLSLSLGHSRAALCRNFPKETKSLLSRSNRKVFPGSRDHCTK